MATERLTGGPIQVPTRSDRAVSPSAAHAGIVTLLRVAAALVSGVVGLLLIAALFAGSAWSWLLWIPAGGVAGAIAQRVRHVWVAVLSVVLFYPLAQGLDLVRNLGPFWMLGAVVGMALTSAGFVVGTAIGWRHDPLAGAAASWRATSRLLRGAVVGFVVVALLGLAGYTSYIGTKGSQEFVHPTGGATGCDTPAQRFGWQYEAINYDPADDLKLAAANPDPSRCASQGALAGNAIVSSDGVPIAGWYIPAKSGVGPTGPTVLIVPGWKSNKSQVLMYAPAFHDAYNVVIADLRNQGRSGPADTTMGLREQLDVRAVLDWLERTKHPSWIAGMGDSMGAATLLAAAGSDPRIRALVLDSMHAHIVDSTGNVLETENGYPATPSAWAIMTGVSMRVGGDVTSIDPVRTIARMGDRPVLLLHSTTDRVDPPAQAAELNFHAALDAGVPVELHYCPGLTTGNGSHGHVLDRCPTEWSRWANQFLAAAQAR